MQRITYRVKVSARGAKRRISHVLRPTKRTSNIKSKFVSSVPHISSSRFSRTKKLVQISSIALLSLPAKSLTTLDSQVPVYDHVMLEKTLTVAAVPGNSTYFATDGFQHGFGYDLVRSYADELGVAVHLNTYATQEAALQALKSGDADMALTTASTQLKTQLGVPSINVSCGYDATLTKNGLNPHVSWAFKKSDDLLSQKASAFLCNSIKLKDTQRLASFYNQNLLKDAYSQAHFKRVLSEKLPDYQTSFEEQAQAYNHDWELLVAMGYQESHLNAEAVSPTGVRGIMMLTNFL